jgi:hypothetical protein
MNNMLQSSVQWRSCARGCSVGAVFFSALSLSLAVILAHGAFREPDNLFIDEADVSGNSALCSMPAHMGCHWSLPRSTC